MLKKKTFFLVHLANKNFFSLSNLDSLKSSTIRKQQSLNSTVILPLGIHGVCIYLFVPNKHFLELHRHGLTVGADRAMHSARDANIATHCKTSITTYGEIVKGAVAADLKYDPVLIKRKRAN